MPMPAAYRHASRDFQAYLDDLRDRISSDSDNVAYTTTLAVFRTIRARLTVEQGLAVADALPAVLRAMFVADWDISAPVQPVADAGTLTREVLAFRQAHNFAPPTAIADVAWALARHLPPGTLARLPAPASAILAPEG